MFSFNKGMCVALGMVILLVPGCGKQRAPIKPLPPLSKSAADFEQAKQGVTVRTKKLSAGQVSEIFGGRKVKFTVGNGRGRRCSTIVPLRVSVKNTSSTAVSFDSRGITPKILDRSAVGNLVGFSSVAPRLGMLALAFGTAFSLFYCLPLVAYCAVGGLFIGPVVAVATLLAGGVISLTPPVAGACLMVRSQGERRDFAKRMHPVTPQGDRLIAPGKSADLLLFFKVAGVTEEIDVTLPFVDEQRKRLTFTVPVSVS